MTADEVQRVAHAGTDGWSAADRELLEFADELCGTNTVSDETWDRLAARWSEPELLELLVVAGFYRLVSGLLNGAGVQLEDGTPGWPAASEAEGGRAGQGFRPA